MNADTHHSVYLQTEFLLSIVVNQVEVNEGKLEFQIDTMDASIKNL